MIKKIRNYFITGLLTFLPAFLTFYVIYLVIRIIYNLMDFGVLLLPESYRGNMLLTGPIVVTTIVLSVLLIIYVSKSAQTLFGRIFQQYINSLLASIPVVKSIYGSFRQFFDVLFVNANRTFQRPVLVPYPHRGKTAIGFATGETTQKMASGETETFYKVFVPTVPNPTSGFLMMFKKEDVTFPDISSEEALRLVLSVGILHQP
jgi:uncharacterized membrane protein